MVGIISSSGLGLFDSSMDRLGQSIGGSIGQSNFGQGHGQNYVNIATGNLSIQFLDKTLSGMGSDLTALRTYNSQGELADGDADGWRWVGEKRLGLSGTLSTAGSTMTRTSGDGSQTVFAWNGTAYVSTAGAGAHDAIIIDNATKEAVYYADSSGRVAERYDNTTGWIKSLRENGGYGFDFTFVENNLTKVLDVQSGQSLELAYGANGKLARMDTRLSVGGDLTRQVYYNYDGSNRLSNVQTDLNPSESSVTDGNFYATIYSYDGTSNRITRILQSDGTSVNFTYDTNNRVASVTDQSGTTNFNYSNYSTVVTDGNGQQWQYLFDADKQLTSYLAPSANGAFDVIDYAYDGQGNLTRVTDGLNNTTTYTYDTSGNRIKEVDALGNTLSRTFSNQNQVLSETRYTVASLTAPSGAETTRNVYDNYGRLRFSVSTGGRVSETRYGSSGLVTQSLEYAGALYLGSGVKETDLQDWVSALSSVNKRKTQLTEFTYDYRGNLAKKISYATVDGNGNGVLDSAADVTEYVYSEYGQLLQTLAVHGADRSTKAVQSTLVYDGLGRQISLVNETGTITTSYDGPQITVSNSSTGLTVVSTTDSLGRLTSLSSAGDRSNRITNYVYDEAGHLRITQDPTGARSYIFYDRAGRISAKVDAVGAITAFVYDRNGRLLTETHFAIPVTASTLSTWINVGSLPASVTPTLDTANDRKTTYTYDAAGRLSNSTVDGLATVTNTYDGKSQLIQTQQGDRITRYVYNKDGQQLGVLDAEGYLSESIYDGAGHLVQRVRYAGQITDITGTFSDIKARALANGSNATLLSFYSYDAEGRIVGTINEQGFFTETVYDAVNNRRQAIQYLTPVNVSINDTLVNLRARAGASETTTTSFDNYGRIETVVAQDGTTSRNVYDTAGRLVRQAQAEGSTDQRATRSRYNAFSEVTGQVSGVGEATIVTNASDSSAAISNAINSYGTRYSYDEAGRRIAEYGPNGQKTLLYSDKNGRVLYSVNMLGEVTRFTYSTFGQITDMQVLNSRIDITGLTGGLDTSVISARVSATQVNAADGRTSYNYNKLGLITNQFDGEGYETKKTYDTYGQVADSVSTLSFGVTTKTSFSYDRLGRAIRTINGLRATTGVVYDGFGRISYTINANGKSTTTNYLDNGRTIVVMDPLGRGGRTEVDAFGRTLKSYDALANLTTYAYDDVNLTTTITHPDGTSIVRKKTRTGETLQVQDENGNITRYTYTKDGKLDRVTDALGVVTTDNNYDTSGRLYETRDANQTVTRYSYDAANRTTTKTIDPNGLNIRTAYAYDGQGRQISVTEGEGTAEASTTKYVYDRKGQIAQMIVDPSGLQLSTRFTYDGVGHTTLVEKGTVATPSQQVTQYTFDELGRKIREQVDPNGLNITTRYGYDKNGNVTQKDDANGNRSWFVYDAGNQLRFSVDPTGYVSERIYDAVGRLSREIHYGEDLTLSQLFDIIGVMQGGADEVASRIKYLIDQKTVSITNVRATSYIYDKTGHLRFTVDATGAFSENVYDAAGNLIRSVNYANKLSTSDIMSLTTLNTLGTNRLINSIFSNPNNGVPEGWSLLTGQVTATAGVNLSADWTAQGLPANDNTAYIHQTGRDSLDAYQELTQTIPSVTAGQTYAFSVYTGAQRARASVHIAWFDSDGNSLGSTTENAASRNNLERVGGTTLSGYKRIVAAGVAPQGAVKAIVIARKQNTLAGQEDSWLFAAHAQFEEISASATSITEWVKALIKPDESNDRTTNFVYDKANRLRFTIDATGALSEKRYDAAGNVIRTIDYANKLSLSDIANAQTTASISSLLNPDFTQDRTTRLIYDKANRLRFTIDATGAVNENIYAALDHVIRTIDYANKLSTSLIGIAPSTEWISALLDRDATQDRSASFVYDKANHLRFAVDANGAISENTYDAVGNVIRTVKYSNTLAASDISSLTTINKLGINILTNPTFTNPSNGVPEGWTFESGYATTTSVGVNLTDWTAQGLAEGDNTLYLHQEGQGSSIAYAELNQTIESVTVGQAYTFSVYTGVHRTIASVQIRWLDEVGNTIGYTDNNPANRNDQEQVGGTVLSNYKRIVASGVAPQGAVKANIVLRKENTAAGQRDSRLFAVHAQFEAATATATEWVKDLIKPDANNDRITTYAYDAAGRQTKTTLAGYYSADAGKVTATADYNDSFQRTSEVIYDALGNATANKIRTGLHTYIYRYKTYDAMGREKNDIDALGYVTQKTYNAFGDIKTLTRSATSVGVRTSGYWFNSEIAVQTGRTITTNYDPAGRKTSVVQPAVAGGTPTTYFSYDAFGGLIKQSVSISGSVTADTYYRYDTLGRQTWVIDALKYGTRTDYDAFGNTTQVIEYATPTTGSITATANPAQLYTTHAKDRISRYTYNMLGKVKTTDASVNGVMTLMNTTDYNTFGEVSRTTDALGATTSMYYNKLGQTTKIVEPERRVAASTEAADFTLADNQILATPTTEITYDTFGQSLQETHSATAGPCAPVTINHSYDLAGNEVATTDGKGNTEYMAYDSNSRVIRQNQFVSVANTAVDYDNSYSHTLEHRFEYDATGRQTANIEVLGGEIAGQVNTYNGYGEIEEEHKVWGALDTPTARLNSTISTKYAYDAAGRMAGKHSSDGYVLFSYDLAGRAIQATQKTANSFNYGGAYVAEDRITQTAYDLLGRVIGQRLPQFSATTGFDQPLTRQTPTVSQTLDRWGNVLTRTDAAGNVTTYQYNQSNQVISETGPAVTSMGADGATLYTNSTIKHSIDYDLAGRVKTDSFTAKDGDTELGKHSTTYFYDTAGQLTKTEGPVAGETTEYAYDIQGNKVATKTGVGIVTLDSFDANSQLLTHSVLRGGAAVTLVAYQYDQAGRQYQETDAAGKSQYYKYDEKGNKFESRDQVGNVRTASFDVFGNKTQDGYIANFYTHTQGTTIIGYAYGRPIYDTVSTPNTLAVPTNVWSYKYSDYEFGRQTSHSAGGVTYDYGYTGFGQLSLEQNRLDTTHRVEYNYYENGLSKQIIETRDSQYTKSSSFGYDIRGNRTGEINSYVSLDLSSPSDISTSHTTMYRYDALNRLEVVKSPVGQIGTSAGRYSTANLDNLTTVYDQWGNRRKVSATYNLPNATSKTINEYYDYDAANRVTVEAGFVNNGKIVAGQVDDNAVGAAYSYDRAGRRVMEERWDNFESFVRPIPIILGFGPFPGGNLVRSELYTQHIYTYNDLNLITTDKTRTAIRGSFADSSADFFLADRDRYVYDTYDDRGFKLTSNNTSTNRTTTYTYNANGTSSGQVVTINGTATPARTESHYESGHLIIVPIPAQPDTVESFVDGYAYDTLGNVLAFTSSQGGMTYNYAYNYIDTYSGRQVKAISVQSSQAGTAAGNTINTYDTRGRLSSAAVTEANPEGNAIGTGMHYYAYNASGQAIGKVQQTFGGPRKTQSYYYQAGNQVAELGDLKIDISPLSAIYSGGNTPGSYTVTTGDTLMSIAQSVLGDGNLWYVIADLNGLVLGPTQAFTNEDAGRHLKIPNSDQAIHNTSTNYKPYNASEITGDLTPSINIAPPKHKGCNAVAIIIIVAVAVLVSVATAGAGAILMGAVTSTVAAGGVFTAGTAVLSGAAGFGWGVAAAAFAGGFAGSLASQTVAKEMGMGDKISLKKALAGGLTSVFAAGAGAYLQGAQSAEWARRGAEGTEKLNTYGKLTLSTANYLTSRASPSVFNLDAQFRWTDMAVAVASPWITNAIGSRVPGVISGMGNSFVNNVAGNFTGSAVSASLNHLMESTPFKKNTEGTDWGATLADAFGNALGTEIVTTMQFHEKVGMLNDVAKKAYKNARKAGDSAQDAYEDAKKVEKQYNENTKERLLTALKQKESTSKDNPYIHAGSKLDAGTAAAHTGLVDVSGLEFVDNQEGTLTMSRHNRIVAFSQLPDQTQLLDGYTSGVRYIKELGVTDEAQTVKLYQEALHALNGKSVAENINFYLDIIDANTDNDAIIGMAMHGLVDGIFHSTYEGNNFYDLLASKTYNAPIGHGAHGSEPDYVNDFKVRTSTLLLSKAYADVSGVSQEAFDNAWLRADSKVTELLNQTKNLSGKSRDLALKNVYSNYTERERFAPGAVNLEDPIFSKQSVFRPGGVTFASDVTNTKKFLDSTPLRSSNSTEFASRFLAEGLSAAATISNSFNARFGRGFSPITEFNYGQDSGGSYLKFLNYKPTSRYNI